MVFAATIRLTGVAFFLIGMTRAGDSQFPLLFDDGEKFGAVGGEAENGEKG
jgi:hypothetical protein